MSDFTRARAALTQALDNDRSSFYSDFYAARGVDIERLPATPPEWQTLPLLEKKDIIAVPVLQRLFVPLSQVGTIRFTSGTTGTGILIMPRRHATHALSDVPRIKGSVLLSFFFYSSMMSRSPAATPYLLIVGDRTKLAQSAELAAREKVDALLGPVSVLIAFAPYLRKHQPLERIRFIRLDMERPGALQLSVLHELYPNAELMNFYALQEVSEVAFTPPDAPHPGLLRVLPDYYFELLTQTGAKALEDITEPAEGEIILTSLYPNAPFPLVRYRTGDRARATKIVGQPFIEILGRAGEDRVRIPGGELVLAELERATEVAFGGAVADFTCTVSEARQGDRLITTATMTLYTRERYIPHGEQEASERLAHTLRVNAKRTWAEGVAHGLYRPLSCSFSALEERPHKIKRLADAR